MALDVAGIIAKLFPGATLRHGFHDPAYPSHVGADFAVAPNTRIYAPSSGTVTYAGWDNASGDGGFGVKLTDVNGASLGFWHLSQAIARVGQTVKVGDVLGLSGQTGNAVYPHVHVQVEKPAGSPIDPIPYLGALLASVPTVIPGDAPGAPAQPAMPEPGKPAGPAPTAPTPFLEPTNPLSGFADTLGGIAAAIGALPAAIINPISQSINQAYSTLAWLGQVNIWKRIGLAIFGVILLLVGIILFAVSFVRPQVAA